MSAFQETLRTLPSVAHLAALALYRTDADAPVIRIENKPGQAGSLAVYHQLHMLFGVIDARAAAHGLELYAEHTADARQHPGKHPNIDHLFQVFAEGGQYRVETIPR